MIRMLADTSFGGNYQDAHNFADVGGDILGVVEWNSTFYVDWQVCIGKIIHLYLVGQ